MFRELFSKSTDQNKPTEEEKIRVEKILDYARQFTSSVVLTDHERLLVQDYFRRTGEENPLEYLNDNYGLGH